MKTISLQGKEYAQVSERLKEFRENCPNALIETTPTIMPDGQVMFKTRILKDKADANSAEATGHAIGDNKGAKAFEKLETISVGRALALLGYMASGEIASSDEMEEFLSYQEEKRTGEKLNAIEILGEVKDLETLRSTWNSLKPWLREDKDLVELKDKLKTKLK